MRSRRPRFSRRGLGGTGDGLQNSVTNKHNVKSLNRMRREIRINREAKYARKKVHLENKYKESRAQ